ncbi:MAG: cytochrome [Burkholderiales bacterium]|jgi:cytochrome c553|nr:cytochrome [Burkholderiales bacterium]
MTAVTKVCWALVLLVAGASAPAWSQDRTAARSLVAACFTCHGTEGRSVGGVPPSLAGMDRMQLLQTLKDFKAGKRPATIMDQQVKGYTDQELEIIADYFAAVKPGPAISAPAPRY